MLQTALNHMTVARVSFAEFLRIARDLGCVGIEARNDLPGPLFDGRPAEDARRMLDDHGLRLLSLAEVKCFNDWSDETRAEACKLIGTAAKAGAEGVSLIPRNDNKGMGNGERQGNLRMALRYLRPILEDHGLIGFVEPLGFETCALRFKAEAVEAIDALDAGRTFRLVHDTFHHHLAQEARIYPAATGIVHISGVVDPTLSLSEMTDAHRILVDERDRLGNLDQVAAMRAAGYDGPISFEAFAPEVHEMTDPVAEIRRSFDIIRSAVAADAA